MTFVLPLLATVWLWVSPEEYAKQSDLIAVLRIGTVHEEKTPESILVRSAVAEVERVIYFRFAPHRKLPEKIVIYQVDPNGQIEGGSAFGEPTIAEGRCFAMLKLRGEDKFTPYARLSLQAFEKEGLHWPTTFGKTEQMSLEQIIGRLKILLRE